MSMYIRVKRQKTTVFLQVEPTDTVLEVKQKLQALLDKSPDKLQLLREVREASGQWLPLDDAKKLAELKVENDDVLALAYAQEGERQQQQQQERQQIACAGRAESAGGRQGSGNSSSSSRADRADGGFERVKILAPGAEEEADGSGDAAAKQEAKPEEQ
uniref:Ubiquitin-like domain-containing protein n=1 Tax=Tetradesmus obliquus TaxID=3088 RepID=A0A383V3P7_TETOB|eukprot:jgi/Sobl393_1/2922/SZX59412.1